MKLSTATASIVVLSILSPAIAKKKNKNYGYEPEFVNGLQYVANSYNHDYGYYKGKKSKKSKSKKYYYKKNRYPVAHPIKYVEVEVKPEAVDPTTSCTTDEPISAEVAPTHDGTIEPSPTFIDTEPEEGSDGEDDISFVEEVAADGFEKPQEIVSNGFKLSLSAISGFAILLAI
jgi:hypothetical protein